MLVLNSANLVRQLTFLKTLLYDVESEKKGKKYMFDRLSVILFVTNNETVEM